MEKNTAKPVDTHSLVVFTSKVQIFCFELCFTTCYWMKLFVNSCPRLYSLKLVLWNWTTGHYPEWDEDHPIHFVGHSAGAQVVRVLQQMLADKVR